jgi:hypothetical protein
MSRCIQILTGAVYEEEFEVENLKLFSQSLETLDFHVIPYYGIYVSKPEYPWQLKRLTLVVRKR